MTIGHAAEIVRAAIWSCLTAQSESHQKSKRRSAVRPRLTRDAAQKAIRACPSGDRAGAAVLLALLHNEDARVRAAAGRALARIRDPHAAPALLAGLGHHPGTWRHSMVPTAYRALRGLGPQTVPAAIDTLRHPEPQVRRSSAAAPLNS